jgi:hypothetical protein
MDRAAQSSQAALRDAACCTSEVCVLFTTVEQTHSAIRVAKDLARALAASLTLINVRPTSYPLQSTPPDADESVHRFVQQVRWQGVEIAVRSYVCGNDRQAIPFAFRPHSIIVVGGKRTWLPTRTERLRRDLEAAGHFVLLVDGTTHDHETAS